MLTFVAGCFRPCPENEVRNNDGYCIAGVVEGDTDTDSDSDSDTDTDTDTDTDADTDCDSHAEQQCSGGDVYWYDSCGVREGVAENCASGENCVNHGSTASCEEDCGSSQDHGQCYGGDLYWYDACGTRKALAESCSQGCIESGDDAACVNVQFRCEDDEYVCSASAERIYVYFTCEANNNSDVPLVFTSMTVRSADPADAPYINSVFRETFTGGLKLPAHSGWTAIPHEGRFAANIKPYLPDYELEIEADFWVLLDTVPLEVFDETADRSRTVEVPRSAFSCIP